MMKQILNQQHFFFERFLQVSAQIGLFSGNPWELKKRKRRAAQFGAWGSNFQLKLPYMRSFREEFHVLSLRSFWAL